MSLLKRSRSASRPAKAFVLASSVPKPCLTSLPCGFERIRLASDGTAGIHLSFDLDVVDPEDAPGTGTPVWGGLHSWQAAAMLRDLAGINMVGGDVVEVSPPYDTTGATAIAGAHVAYELICLYHWAKTRR